MEFEWINFPGFTTMGILVEIEKFMKGSSSCQCTTTFHGENEETQKRVSKSVTVANYARRFPLGCWSFLGPGSEKKWYGTYSDKPDGDWDKTAEHMMLNLAESRHPIFRSTSAWKEEK